MNSSKLDQSSFVDGSPDKRGQKNGKNDRSVSYISEMGKSFNNASMNISVNSCLVCFDNAPDTVFLDCGHGGLCYECALDVWKKTGECYLCRNVFDPKLMKGNCEDYSD